MPVAYSDFSTNASVSSVYLNGNPFVFNPSVGAYVPNNPVKNLAAETWSVNGASGIPSFVYTNPVSFPSCDAFSAVPDTIYKSKGFTIHINNVANIKSGTFSISNSAGYSERDFSAPLHAGNNVITAVPDHIYYLQNKKTAYLTAICQNTIAVNFSGKSFKFIRQRSYRKQIQIKP